MCSPLITTSAVVVELAEGSAIISANACFDQAKNRLIFTIRLFGKVDHWQLNQNIIKILA
jgi:hypothetical protein